VTCRRLLSLAALLALAACGKPRGGGAPASRTVPDATGVAVPLPARVARVVTTVPGQTDLVEALGAGARLVGQSDRDEPRASAPGAARIPTWPTVPAERVAALEPDLLLVDSTLSSVDLPALRARFPSTFACDSRSLDGLARTFERVGEALGEPARAKELVDALARARATMRVAGKPKVLLLAQADEPLMVLGPGSLLDDMVRAVGAENVAADLPRPSGEWSPEEVRARRPEWILVTGGRFSDATRARFSDVPAVASGRVVDASGDDLVRAGPRTAKALERLAAILRGDPR